MSNAISTAHAHLQTPKTAEQKPLNPAQQAKAADVRGREFGQLVASIAKAKHDTAPTPTTGPGAAEQSPGPDAGTLVDVTA